MFPVSLNNFHFEDWNFTCTLAAGITSADVGKAVALDTTANTVKLAADDDVILGRLEQVEDRVQEGQLVGTVAFKFGGKLPIADGETINVGDTLIGAGGGEVKASPTTVTLTDSGAQTVDVAVPPSRFLVVAVVSGEAITLAL